MGFGVKLLCWMVHYVFRMVHDGTQGEASDALRIRYAPRAATPGVGGGGVPAFLVLLYTHTIPTNAFFSVPTKNRYARESALFTASK